MESGDTLERDGEGIDIPRLIHMIWKSRLWIVSITFFVGAMGAFYSLIAPTVYVADAIIAPKESKSGGAGVPFLSQMGNMGGLGVQFGLGNASLDRLEYMARSRDLAERVINQNDLLPKLFSDRWIGRTKSWKDGIAPDMREATELIRMRRVSITPNSKKGVLVLSFRTPDSTFSAELARGYLTSLNKKIRDDVLGEADANRRFLEGQLMETSDPLLREKIQNLIGLEIEKSMLVSTKSFDVLETPVVPHIREKPKRKLIVIISLVAGFFLSLLAVVSLKGIKVQIARLRSAATNPL
jgi:uncharacterized protein involved in exopolysaccharide biosynthesis